MAYEWIGPGQISRVLQPGQYDGNYQQGGEFWMGDRPFIFSSGSDYENYLRNLPFTASYSGDEGPYGSATVKLSPGPNGWTPEVKPNLPTSTWNTIKPALAVLGAAAGAGLLGGAGAGAGAAEGSIYGGGAGLGYGGAGAAGAAGSGLLGAASTPLTGAEIGAAGDFILPASGVGAASIPLTGAEIGAAGDAAILPAASAGGGLLGTLKDVGSTVGSVGSGVGNFLKDNSDWLKYLLPLAGGALGYLDSKSQEGKTQGGDPWSRDYLRGLLANTPQSPWGKY